MSHSTPVLFAGFRTVRLLHACALALVAAWSACAPANLPSTEPDVRTSEQHQSLTAPGMAELPSLPHALRDPGAVLLADGRVLIAGGRTGDGVGLRTARIFDPVTGKLTSAAPMRDGRWSPGIILLRSGKVLVVGGTARPGFFVPTCELFDPVSDAWSAMSCPGFPLFDLSLTALENGTVLAVRDGQYAVYTPESGTWTERSATPFKITGTTIARLHDGRVLGIGSSDSQGVLFSVDGATASGAGALVDPARGAPTVITLADGRVLVGGGGPGCNRTLEVYTPGTPGAFSSTFRSIQRCAVSASLFPDGRVAYLHCGLELYEPLARELSAPFGAVDVAPGSTQVLLPDGRLLVLGGVTACDGAEPSGRVLLVGGPSATVVRSDALPNREGSTATLLTSGKVLIAGGIADRAYQASSLLLDLATGTHGTVGGEVSALRRDHRAVLLTDGEVLITGGRFGAEVLASTLRYDPVANLMRASEPLPSRRVGHSMTLLPDGDVLVVGGSHTSASDEAYRFDPATGTWTDAGTIPNGAREAHTATLLADGRVLVAGGQGAAGALSSWAIYDPSNSTWSAGTSAMPGARAHHAATLLQDGRVLLTGGQAAGISLSQAAVFDPKVGTWGEVTAMPRPFVHHAAQLLPTGKVLLAGGDGTAESTTTVLYDPLTNDWLNGPELASPLGVPVTSHSFDGDAVIVGGQASRPDRIDRFRDGWEGSPLRPVVLAPVEEVMKVGATWTLETDGLLGRSDLHGGNLRSSGANVPLVQLRRMEDGPQLFLRTIDWGESELKVVAPRGLMPGLYLARVVMQGLTGPAQVIQVERLADGATCEASEACNSGSCVAGICCATACNGSCETCAAPGQEGSCVPLSPATVVSQCAPYVCDGSSGECPQACNEDAACAEGYDCEETTATCVQRVPPNPLVVDPFTFRGCSSASGPSAAAALLLLGLLGRVTRRGRRTVGDPRARLPQSAGLLVLLFLTAAPSSRAQPLLPAAMGVEGLLPLHAAVSLVSASQAPDAAPPDDPVQPSADWRAAFPAEALGTYHPPRSSVMVVAAGAPSVQLETAARGLEQALRATGKLALVMDDSAIAVASGDSDADLVKRSAGFPISVVAILRHFPDAEGGFGTAVVTVYDLEGQVRVAYTARIDAPLEAQLDPMGAGAGVTERAADAVNAALAGDKKKASKASTKKTVETEYDRKVLGYTRAPDGAGATSLTGEPQAFHLGVRKQPLDPVDVYRLLGRDDLVSRHDGQASVRTGLLIGGSAVGLLSVLGLVSAGTSTSPQGPLFLGGGLVGLAAVVTGLAWATEPISRTELASLVDAYNGKLAEQHGVKTPEGKTAGRQREDESVTVAVAGTLGARGGMLVIHGTF